MYFFSNYNTFFETTRLHSWREDRCGSTASCFNSTAMRVILPHYSHFSYLCSLFGFRSLCSSFQPLSETLESTGQTTDEMFHELQEQREREREWGGGGEAPLSSNWAFSTFTELRAIKKQQPYNTQEERNRKNVSFKLIKPKYKLSGKRRTHRLVRWGTRQLLFSRSQLGKPCVLLSPQIKWN